MKHDVTALKEAIKQAEKIQNMAIDEGLKKGCRDIPSNIVEMAIAFADALINELKKGGEK